MLHCSYTTCRVWNDNGNFSLFSTDSRHYKYESLVELHEGNRWEHTWLQQ